MKRCPTWNPSFITLQKIHWLCSLTFLSCQVNTNKINRSSFGITHTGHRFCLWHVGTGSWPNAKLVKSKCIADDRTDCWLCWVINDETFTWSWHFLFPTLLLTLCDFPRKSLFYFSPIKFTSASIFFFSLFLLSCFACHIILCWRTTLLLSI